MYETMPPHQYPTWAHTQSKASSTNTVVLSNNSGNSEYGLSALKPLGGGISNKPQYAQKYGRHHPHDSNENAYDNTTPLSSWLPSNLRLFHPLPPIDASLIHDLKYDDFLGIAPHTAGNATVRRNLYASWQRFAVEQRVSSRAFGVAFGSAGSTVGGGSGLGGSGVGGMTNSAMMMRRRNQLGATLTSMLISPQ